MDHLTAVKIELLEGAYRHLNKTHTYFVQVGICWGLEVEANRRRDRKVLENFDPPCIARRELTAYITRALGCSTFYYGWLGNIHGIHDGYEEIRRGRLAWIDAMIAALEKGEPLPEKPSLPSDYKGEV